MLELIRKGGEDTKYMMCAYVITENTMCRDLYFFS